MHADAHDLIRSSATATTNLILPALKIEIEDWNLTNQDETNIEIKDCNLKLNLRSFQSLISI